MPSVVVDTNILIRALLKPDSSDGIIIRNVKEGKYNLFFSLSLITELKRVLNYERFHKFGITNEKIDLFLKLLFSIGTVISPVKKISVCRDPDDNELLSVAVSIYQDEMVFLITGDKDVLVLRGKIENVNIITPQEFLKQKVVS